MLFPISSGIRMGLLGFEDSCFTESGVATSNETFLFLQLLAYVLFLLEDHQEGILGKLAFDCISCHELYLPMMPEDEFSMVHRVLASSHKDCDKEKISRWITCPNGHPIAMTRCKSATQIITCIDCGSILGGDYGWDHYQLQEFKEEDATLTKK